jgi:hypothetical protein
MPMRAGARLGLDGRWTWDEEEDDGALRWYAGGVVALGRR